MNNIHSLSPENQLQKMFIYGPRSLYLWPNHDDKCQMWQTLEMDTGLSHPLSPLSFSVVETFCKYSLAMRIGNRKYLWLAQHITHLISILVFGQCPPEDSTKMLSPNIYAAWLDFRHALGQSLAHLSEDGSGESSDIFWWFHFCLYGCLIRLRTLSLFAKGLRPTNDCNLQQWNGMDARNLLADSIPLLYGHRRLFNRV